MTTEEAATKIAERTGTAVTAGLVRSWLKRDAQAKREREDGTFPDALIRFPNARLVDTPRGPVWDIPEEDVAVFERRPRGRPLDRRSANTPRTAE